ncbi:Calcineurin-like phosphoesterase [Mucilaginibacter gossypiicola]|uniref:Calcineurin-like phosphoesterase n=1 Tax=Mucilaginibacter gossypiicola TaxID=551995 RepID=A0A1H8D8U3_9SPHI|nr:metallophosphoesterase [Mucilaginibacter gossypiicola]SEN03771.1 Calcineurin-like phosphoesterase [Mucilaginibacter gossypiicola]
MADKTSILHISDLHRSKELPISNGPLVSSLISDRDKYVDEETPNICSPNLIIVSGDIVRGSSNPDVLQSIDEIENQYNEAEEFLTSLCDNFLDGDKKKLIIIPGNHDIDWKYSKESMEKLDKAAVFDTENNINWAILKDAFTPQSSTRWSWKDLSFFKIKNTDIYNKRLAAFAKFYHKFYDGDRTYSLNPADQYDIFDYPELDLSVIAYSSCYNNDHLRFVGDIHPDCISKSSSDIRELIKRGRLIIGTWHHNTKGGPFESNYMDGSILKNFIDSKISIGFHGHQHRMEAIHEHNDIIQQKSIIVIGAGTLCGGREELPTGTNRQYNVIELDREMDEGKLEVTLHVREKSESSSFNNPIWIPGRIASSNASFYSFKIKDPRKVDITTQMLDIEKLISNGDYGNAKSKLIKMDLNDAFVRGFLLQCIIETDDHELAIEKFAKPQSIKETVIVFNAATRLKRMDVINEVVTSIDEKIIKDPTVKQLFNQAKAML